MIDRSSYWTNKLADLNIPKLSLNFSHSPDKSSRTIDVPFVLNCPTIVEFCSKHQLTITHILTATLLHVIERHTHEKDICIQLAAENHPTLPLRILINVEQTFLQLINAVRDNHQEGLDHQLPLAQIHEALPFDTRLILSSHASTNMLLCVNQPTENFADEHLGKFVFSFMTDTHGILKGQIKCDEKLFSAQELTLMIARAQYALDFALNEPESTLANIPLLPKSELDSIAKYNLTDKPAIFGQQLAPQILSSKARELPDHIFLRYHPDPEAVGDVELTENYSYRAFDEYTNQIANYLRHHCDIKNGDRIILSVARNMHLIAFIYGILKAGAVVEPFESVASSFLQTKLKSSKAVLCITDNTSQHLFAAHGQRININDEFTIKAILNCSKGTPNVVITAKSPAYIEYSSGTTSGIPKGALISHGSFANLHNALPYENFPKQLELLCTASEIFDALFFDLAAVVAYGGTLNLTPDRYRLSITAIENISRKYHINFAALLPHIISDLSPNIPITYIISMGQAARGGDFERLLDSHKQRTITNGLGHTETGICLCLQIYRSGESPDLIGTPIANMKIFIVAPDTQSLCPIGVSGEMYITGPGLADGYLDNPTLNQKHFRTMRYAMAHQRFIECSPEHPDAQRVYASGDLATLQVTKAGNLSLRFNGRVDSRTKMCGVLVDRDGVENIISKHEKVKEVCVIPNAEGTALFAYLVLHEPMKELDARSMIWEYLKTSTLPRILFPYTLLVKTFPVTRNGKTDVKELMAMRKPEMLEPSNGPLSEIITDIWCDTLLLDRKAKVIDRHKSFKHYGGDSESLVRLKLHLNQKIKLVKPITIGEHLNPNTTLTSLETSLKRMIANKTSSNNYTLMRQNRPITNKESSLSSGMNYHY